MWRLFALIGTIFLGAPVAADERSPQPERPFAACEDRYPESIEGEWRSDPQWTRRELLATQDDAAAAGEVAVATSAGMTITSDALIVEIPHLGRFERPYTLVGGSHNRFVLEFRDATGAASVTTIELVPCGLALEGRQDCDDQFCRNAMHEIFEAIAAKSGGRVTAEELRLSAELSTRGHVAPRRVYYRRVAPRATSEGDPE